MYHDLTEGKISRSLLLFALPMMAGNLLQQFYNIADTLIVGRVLGSNALAAVGSAYTLMTFLTSIFLGLSMGSGALFSIYKGKNDQNSLRSAIVHAFALIMAVTVLLNVLVYIGIDPILHFLRVPDEVWDGMKAYLLVIFAGIIATSLYNYFFCLLRALGNSTIPLVFLAVSAVLNIGLDLLFVAVLPWGIRGAALATVIAQYVSGIGITLYVLLKCRDLLPSREDLQFNRQILGEIGNLSSMTCVQQSVMNFGILMVQGLVNSFGPVVMAAFAAAVKIDTFAYLPVQDFGNAYSTFIAQNYGAGKKDRIRKGTKGIIPDQFSFLYCDLGGGMYFCRTADADLCQCEGNCSYCFRCALSPDRGGFLLRNRLSVFAVWLLSCSQETGHVRHPDCDISRNTCSSGVYPVCIYRRNRHLDGDPDRMGACRCYRPRLYEISRKIVTSGNSIQIQKQKSAVPVKDTCKPCILISRYCNYWKNRFRHEASKTAPAGIRTTFILSFLHIQQAGMSFFHSSLPVIILLFYLLFFCFFVCQNLFCHLHFCFFILRKNDIQDDCE